MLALTSQRLLFKAEKETSWFATWFFIPTKEWDIELDQIRSVGRTTLLSWVFGGQRLEIKLKGGKTHRLWILGRWDAWDEQDGLNKWVRLLRTYLRGEDNFDRETRSQRFWGYD